MLSRMKTVAEPKTKSEAELLAKATHQLLRAAKAKLVKKQGRVDYGKLHKAGYSDRFLARLEAA